MALVYRAEEHEAALLREVFGSGIDGVMFYDGEDYEDPWMVVGYDADGEEIGRAYEQDESEAIEAVFQIPGDRDLTVKFGISL